MNRLIYKSILLGLTLLSLGLGVANAATFKIGILSFQSKEETMQKWIYLESYLAKKTNSSDHFKVVPMFYDELDRAVAKGSVDFVLTNTGHYVMLEKQHGLSAIASLEKRVGDSLLDRFGGVIFTRSDRSDLNSLNDLKDASFMAVKAASLGGYLAAAGEFQKNGIDSKNDFRRLLFTGMPHQKVVENILAGKADAGTVRTGILESLVANGTIKTSDFKVLNAKSTANFPLLHSTELYPEWPLSVMPHTDGAVANRVTLALISINALDQTPHRWMVSKNYKHVHQLMMNLKMPPYDKGVDIWGESKKYKSELLTFILAILALIYFSVSLYRSNNKLMVSQKRFKNTAVVLEHIATNERFEDTLNNITAMVESDFPTIKSSILLLKNGRLYKGAAPSLPEAYNSALEGLEIGPEVGSCGTAAYFTKRIIVEDIATDPLWSSFKALALQHKLCSCWSEPILDSKGNVLGTLAMYSHQRSSPSSRQLELISSAAHLAGIAIEREQVKGKLQKLVQAVEQTGESIIITDQYGDIEFVNHAFTVTTGYSFEEAVGKNPNILSSGRQDKLFYKTMWKELNENRSWLGRIWNKRKNGEIYPERLHISAVKNSEGETHYIALFSDISDQLSVEEQLQHAQKMETVGTLVGGIAHDFNNILAGMLGNTYLIKKKYADHQELFDKINGIEELGFRAKDLITQMLAFARKGVLEKSDMDLAECVQKAIDLAKAVLPKEILFHESIEQETCFIHADDALLQQVIINMVNNARDAVENVTEAEINISLTTVAADDLFTIPHALVPVERYACLTISDNGSGMSKETIAHIFDPFYTTKEINKGTGLGLSMAIGTVQSHHGHIDVDSKKGKGTSFHVYLPLLEEEKKESTREAALAEPLSNNTGAHILIADDERHIRETMVEILEDDGYIVYSAVDGREALSIFQEHKSKIHLAILDMSMPGKSGMQVAKEIREEYPSFPIVFNSGYDQSEMRDEMANYKYCSRLQKPVEMGQLKQAICDLLDS